MATQPARKLPGKRVIEIGIEESVEAFADLKDAREWGSAIEARVGDGGTAMDYVRAMLAEAEARQSWPLAFAMGRAVKRIEAEIAELDRG